MRINIYHHEVDFMAARPEWIKKEADTGVVFHGLRLYTEAPLMHQPGDDDSSAITIWVPWTKANGHDVKNIRQIAENITAFCDFVEKR